MRKHQAEATACNKYHRDLHWKTLFDVIVVFCVRVDAGWMRRSENVSDYSLSHPAVTWLLPRKMSPQAEEKQL